jgi:membrane protein DedA with SNARE-associated domain
MEQLVIQWGYWAIVLGCFLEGETVLVIGGVLAHRGLLRLDWVILFACLGSLIGDQLWFLFGRFAGKRWLGRFQRLTALSERLTLWSTHHGAWFALGFRFLYGIRTVAPLFLGASHYPIQRFVPLNAVGAIVWSVAVAMLGWSLGATVERLLGRAARIEEVLLLGAVLILTLLWWHKHRLALAKE